MGHRVGEAENQRHKDREVEAEKGARGQRRGRSRGRQAKGQKGRGVEAEDWRQRQK